MHSETSQTNRLNENLNGRAHTGRSKTALNSAVVRSSHSRPAPFRCRFQNARSLLVNLHINALILIRSIERDLWRLLKSWKAGNFVRHHPLPRPEGKNPVALTARVQVAAKWRQRICRNLLQWCAECAAFCCLMTPAVAAICRIRGVSSSEFNFHLLRAQFSATGLCCLVMTETAQPKRGGRAYHSVLEPHALISIPTSNASGAKRGRKSPDLLFSEKETSASRSMHHIAFIGAD